MNFYLEYAADGRVITATEAPEPPPASFGGTVIETEQACNAGQTVVVDGVPQDIGPPPTVHHVIDPLAQAWVLNLTTEECIRLVQVRLQSVMDEAARALGYDDIKTAITYADEPAVPKFQAEGQALRAWRSLVWAACYAHPAMTGAAPIPTPDEAEALMPPLALPDA